MNTPELLCRSLLLMLLILVHPGWLVAATGQGKQPILIEADRMVSRQQDRSVVFSGKVEAKQGDMILRGAEMVVYHDATSPGEDKAALGGNASQIKRIIITGQVEIIRQGVVATGDRAEYLASNSEVLLTGHAKIIQDNNMVTGHTVKMNMDQGTTEIIPEKSSGGRVVGYFYPSQQEGKGSALPATGTNGTP